MSTKAVVQAFKVNGRPSGLPSYLNGLEGKTLYLTPAKALNFERRGFGKRISGALDPAEVNQDQDQGQKSPEVVTDQEAKPPKRKPKKEDEN